MSTALATVRQGFGAGVRFVTGHLPDPAEVAVIGGAVAAIQNANEGNKSGLLASLAVLSASSRVVTLLNRIDAHQKKTGALEQAHAQQIHKLATEILNLKQQLQDAKALEGQGVLQGRIRELETQLKELSQPSPEVAELREQVTNLTRERDSHAQRLHDLAQQPSEVEGLRGQVARLTEERDSHAQRLHDLAQQPSEVDALRDHATNLATEMNARMRELTTSRAQIEAVRTALNADPTKVSGGKQTIIANALRALKPATPTPPAT